MAEGCEQSAHGVHYGSVESLSRSARGAFIRRCIPARSACVLPIAIQSPSINSVRALKSGTDTRDKLSGERGMLLYRHENSFNA
jgi:hypothetical protein